MFNPFRPDWASSKPSVRLAAIERRADSWNQKTKQIAKNQRIFAKLVKTDKDDHVREAAVRHLRDSAVLAEVARTDPSAKVRRTAVAGLAPDTYSRCDTDWSMLASIVTSDCDTGVRLEALKVLGTILDRHLGTLPDAEAFIYRLAQSDPEIRVRLGAVAELGWKARHLVDLVKTPADNEVRIAAAKRMVAARVIDSRSETPEEFAQIVETDPDSAVRQAVRAYLEWIEQRTQQRKQENEEATRREVEERTRREKTQQAAQAVRLGSDESIVEQLCRLADTGATEEIRAIGIALAANGGEQRMVRICDRVRLTGAGENARFVERCWDGIGGWLG